MKPFTVAVIQWASWADLDAVGRRARLRAMVHEAAVRNAQLVVLPRLAGNVALGDDLRGGWADLTSECGSYERHADFFGDLAAGEGVHIIAGSAFEQASGSLEAAVVYSAAGEIAGRAVRVHVRSENGRLAGGSDITAFDLPWVRLGLLTADDAWSPEQCRILALAGCDLLVSLQAIRAPYNRWKQVAGLWQQVQQNQVYGAESCLVGGGLAGVSSVLGPCDMAPRFSGYLCEAEHPDRDAVLTCTLKPDSLLKAREIFPVFEHLNTALYDREFPAVFSGGEPQ